MKNTLKFATAGLLLTASSPVGRNTTEDTPKTPKKNHFNRATRREAERRLKLAERGKLKLTAREIHDLIIITKSK